MYSPIRYTCVEVLFEQKKIEPYKYATMTLYVTTDAINNFYIDALSIIEVTKNKQKKDYIETLLGYSFIKKYLDLEEKYIFLSNKMLKLFEYNIEPKIYLNPLHRKEDILTLLDAEINFLILFANVFLYMSYFNIVGNYSNFNEVEPSLSNIINYYEYNLGFLSFVLITNNIKNIKLLHREINLKFVHLPQLILFPLLEVYFTYLRDCLVNNKIIPNNKKLQPMVLYEYQNNFTCRVFMIQNTIGNKLITFKKGNEAVEILYEEEQLFSLYREQLFSIIYTLYAFYKHRFIQGDCRQNNIVFHMFNSDVKNLRNNIIYYKYTEYAKVIFNNKNYFISSHALNTFVIDFGNSMLFINNRVYGEDGKDFFVSYCDKTLGITFPRDEIDKRPNDFFKCVKYYDLDSLFDSITKTTNYQFITANFEDIHKKVRAKFVSDINSFIKNKEIIETNDLFSDLIENNFGLLCFESKEDFEQQVLDKQNKELYYIMKQDEIDCYDANNKLVTDIELGEEYTKYILDEMQKYIHNTN